MHIFGDDQQPEKTNPTPTDQANLRAFRGLKWAVGPSSACASLCRSMHNFGDDQQPKKRTRSCQRSAGARLSAIEVGCGTFFCFVRPCADFCTISAMTNCRKKQTQSRRI